LHEPFRQYSPFLFSRRVALRAAAAAFVFGTGTALAQSVVWVDWTSAPTTHSAVGVLNLPSGKVVNVKFNGPSMYFMQTGAPSDTDYWSDGGAYAVTGRPTGSDLLAFKGGTDALKYKITFSKPVTDPVMAIVTLGRSGIPVRYVFKQKPTLLSSGSGFWGGCSNCLKVKRNKLTGTEGHGVVQFIGTFESITWEQPDFEEWHGLTVGVPN
jgi:hypothetical protein